METVLFILLSGLALRVPLHAQAYKCNQLPRTTSHAWEIYLEKFFSMHFDPDSEESPFEEDDGYWRFNDYDENDISRFERGPDWWKDDDTE